MSDNNSNQNNDFSSASLLFFILKWRKPIIIVMALTAITSAGISLLITPKYLSTAIFFPANNSSLSKGLMTEDAQGKNDLSKFGEEEQAEAMLQILNSDKIRWRLWGKYQMMEHYEIDPSDKYAQTQLSKTWDDNVSFRRTEFNSIRIDVLDTDKDLAATLANEIASLVDTMRNEMIQARAQAAYEIMDEEYNGLVSYMKELDDSLTVLRNKGVQDYEKQIEMITGVYYQAIAENNTRAVNQLQTQLDTLAKYGSASKSMTENLEFLRERLVLLRGKYDEIKVDATKDLTWKFVVNEAVAAEKKAYPIRWLIVLVSTLASLLLAVLVIIGVENYNKYAAQLKN
ncbi:MAG: Wzz/FepE/Etk N-terminal domain-containing protein [Salibacteraceae bacterium]